MNKNDLLSQISNTTDDTEIIRLLRANDFEGVKILWSEEEVKLDAGGNAVRYFLDTVRVIPAWRYHLQALILADDIKKYIEENTNL